MVTIKRLIKKFKRLDRKSYTTTAGAIAFFFTINFGSIIYLLFLLTHLFFIDIETQLHFLPEAIRGIVLEVYTTSTSVNPNYSIFFILSCVITTSTLFYHIIKAGEIIYEEKREEFTFQKRLIALLLVFVFLVFMVLAFVTMLIGDYIITFIPFNLASNAWSIAQLFLMPFLFILLINYFAIPHKAKFKEILFGSLTTTIWWFSVTYAFTIYLKLFASFKAIYGQLTFIIVAMVWIYLLSLGLVIGFWINDEIRRRNYQSYIENKSIQ